MVQIKMLAADCGTSVCSCLGTPATERGGTQSTEQKFLYPFQLNPLPHMNWHPASFLVCSNTVGCSVRVLRDTCGTNGNI